MSNVTGFKAFWIYVTIKNIYFNNAKYDLVKQGFPRKAHFIKLWNEKHVHGDGKLFFDVEQQYPDTKDLIQLFAVYFWYDQNFFVTDVLGDRFKRYRDALWELDNIERVFVNDLRKVRSYCADQSVSLKKVIHSESRIPKIFSLDISPFSLVIFDSLFDIAGQINTESINILERDKAKKLKIKVDKFSKLFYSQLRSVDWKDTFRKELGS